MRFVVILKQIPDDSIKKEYQDVDQLNDSDKNVIKEALDLRDRYGGTVDVIGFGPLSAEDVMKETLTYGIDDAFLISLTVCQNRLEGLSLIITVLLDPR